ncbi:MAG: hypothetical protein BWY90_00063 [Deltaproteobacteria bacterium ADurb.BinA014]|nr:MAG: hypothetical protein BWY90_00063 [Deltaproteobacteria bacterium ADurb.BinA014]
MRVAAYKIRVHNFFDGHNNAVFRRQCTEVIAGMRHGHNSIAVGISRPSVRNGDIRIVGTHDIY